MKTIKNHKLKLKTKIQKFIARKSNTQKYSIKCFVRGNKNNSTNNIDKLLKKNLERIKKKYTALKEKYKKATDRIKNLKNDILKKNDDCKIYPNNNDKKYKKINEIYTPEKYINLYIKKSTSLYKQYEDYINNKISKDRKFNYNEKNSFINNLNNMNNVSDFLINIKALSDITYKKFYNLLRRTLIKINGSESFLINDKKVTESKTDKDIIFSDKNDKYKYIESLYDSNDQELIFVSNLIFILGLLVIFQILKSKILRMISQK